MVSNKALSFLIDKIYYKFVYKHINEGTSIEDILSELKDVGIDPNGTLKRLEDYIIYHFNQVWDYDKNKWIVRSQNLLQLIDSNSLVDKITEDLIATLSPTDTETLLKDIKTISKDTKTIVKKIGVISSDIEELVGNIETIVVAISEKQKVE